MDITILDRSVYFKGLLLLIRKDHKITDSEIQLMKHIGKILGFEPSFCDNAIQNILENKYILDETPIFSSKEIATLFIKDGLYLASSDNEVHPLEEEWLKDIVMKNDLDLEWYHQQKLKIENYKSSGGKLEVEKLFVG